MLEEIDGSPPRETPCNFSVRSMGGVADVTYTRPGIVRRKFHSVHDFRRLRGHVGKGFEHEHFLPFD